MVSCGLLSHREPLGRLQGQTVPHSRWRSARSVRVFRGSKEVTGTPPVLPGQEKAVGQAPCFSLSTTRVSHQRKWGSSPPSRKCNQANQVILVTFLVWSPAWFAAILALALPVVYFLVALLQVWAGHLLAHLSSWQLRHASTQCAMQRWSQSWGCIVCRPPSLAAGRASPESRVAFCPSWGQTWQAQETRSWEVAGFVGCRTFVPMCHASLFGGCSRLRRHLWVPRGRLWPMRVLPARVTPSRLGSHWGNRLGVSGGGTLSVVEPLYSDVTCLLLLF